MGYKVIFFNSHNGCWWSGSKDYNNAPELLRGVVQACTISLPDLFQEDMHNGIDQNKQMPSEDLD